MTLDQKNFMRWKLTQQMRRLESDMDEQRRVVEDAESVLSAALYRGDGMAREIDSLRALVDDLGGPLDGGVLAPLLATS